MFSINDIADEIQKGNYLLLAKTITQIENGVAGMDRFLQNLSPLPVPVIGITGPPGAGKSSLISALVGNWVQANKKVAVLSVDPSSPFHHGAILGDRIRMKEWYLHPNVFIRSLATRGHLGGLNSCMIELTTLLQSVGFDYIIVETVGVGQSEVEVAALADTTVVVLVPEAGDEVQMMKSGLMEVADIFVVNKSDRPDAKTFAAHIHNMLMENAGNSNRKKVVSTIATQCVGIGELIHEIDMHHQFYQNSGANKKHILQKVIQIILAQKLKQIDSRKIEMDLEIAMNTSPFNVFAFANQYVD